MKIGMILTSSYPEDSRVTKEVTSLIEAGHEIFLLCSRREKDSYEEVVNKIKVTRIDAGKTLYVTTFWDTINAAFWVHPLFAKALPDFIEKNGIEILHVHDLPITNTVLKIAKKKGLKVILDMHENYPAGLVNWAKFKTNPIVKLKNKLFFNYQRWFNYEQRMVKQVDGIIAVVKEMKSRVKKVHKVPEEKIVVVTNNEPKSFAKKFEFQRKINGTLQG
ncbi:MAG: glycosyltransferase family 4 protein [Saprospiraceae bacterium]